MKVAFIGSGNVATHIALKLKDAGEEIVCIFSKTVANAESLAAKVGCYFTANPSEVPGADVYIVSVKDDCIGAALKGVGIPDESIVVHTAGSVDMMVLKDFATNFGVIYPMQTFSKTKPVDWNQIPLFIEANNDNNLSKLDAFAHKLSPNVKTATSAGRKIIHLASVFACNFTNEIYAIADRLLSEHGIEFSTLYPLIDETVEKIKVMKPACAQTGPAKRGDEKVLKMQEGLLSGTDLEIYKLLSKAIQDEQLQRESPQD